MMHDDDDDMMREINPRNGIMTIYGVHGYDDDGRWGFMGTLFSGKAILQDLRSLKEPRR